MRWKRFCERSIGGIGDRFCRAPSIHPSGAECARTRMHGRMKKFNRRSRPHVRYLASRNKLTAEEKIIFQRSDTVRRTVRGVRRCSPSLDDTDGIISSRTDRRARIAINCRLIAKSLAIHRGETTQRDANFRAPMYNIGVQYTRQPQR